MTNAPDNPRIDLQEVTTRHHHARRIIAGLSASYPTPIVIWQQVQAALSDAPALATEITRLQDELTGTRLERANLAAAARATIAAHHDGESDPLSYLRDELSAQGYTDQSRTDQGRTDQGRA